MCEFSAIPLRGLVQDALKRVSYLDGRNGSGERGEGIIYISRRRTREQSVHARSPRRVSASAGAMGEKFVPLKFLVILYLFIYSDSRKKVVRSEISRKRNNI